jgi:hypothetical protein
MIFPGPPPFASGRKQTSLLTPSPTKPAPHRKPVLPYAELTTPIVAYSVLAALGSLNTLPQK